jgi:glyoxylase I family protein
LLVEDLDDTVVELRERGVEVSDPRPVGSSRQAFVSDPSGNVIELHQASG